MEENQKCDLNRGDEVALVLVELYQCNGDGILVTFRRLPFTFREEFEAYERGRDEDRDTQL